MLTRPQSIFKTTLTGAGGVSAAAAQTVEDKVTLTPQNRRLEGIDLQLRLSTGAGAWTATYAGIAGFIKRIRLMINDGVTGNQRPAVDVVGYELLQYLNGCRIQPDRFTAQGWVSDFNGLAANTSYILHFYIPCYDAEMGEKAIPFMSVPMYQLKENASLQVDLGIATDIGVGGTITGNVNLDWKPRYRIEDTVRPYIPWELRTDWFKWAKSGSQSYDFTQSGIMTKFVLSNYVSDGPPVRGAILTNSALYELKQGLTSVDQFNENHQIARSDRGLGTIYPQGTTTAASPVPGLAYRNIPNSFLYSLIMAPETEEAFGVQSAIDLRVKQGSAERFSLYFNDVNAAGNISAFTMFRMLPFADNDLLLLSGGV
jgi:hypothetical protein